MWQQAGGRGLCVQQLPLHRASQLLLMSPAAIGCEVPQVQNGKVHGLQSTYRAGETLEFSCDVGYAAEDTYESQCQPGGSWDPPVPACEEGECGYPEGSPACSLLLAGSSSLCGLSPSPAGQHQPCKAASASCLPLAPLLLTSTLSPSLLQSETAPRLQG